MRVESPVGRHEPSHNAGLMLAHRLRQWPSIKPALNERLVFAHFSSVSALLTVSMINTCLSGLLQIT